MAVRPFTFEYKMKCCSGFAPKIFLKYKNLFSFFSCHFFISEIARIQSGGKPPGRDSKFVDIYHEKPIRLTVRALVPVKEHPKVS